MDFVFAPMEGISTHIYRRLHSHFFGGVKEYFAPFIAPDGSGTFKSGSLRDILPENNEGLITVPQLLVNQADAFLKVASELAAMGYTEVNLNIGCPSATVVSKHKGAGMLLDLSSLHDCLDRIFSGSPVAVSIKTRMGIDSTEEFPQILELYNQFPLKRLIIHARARSGMYKSPVDTPAFFKALPVCRCPVMYNGDIFSPEDMVGLGEPACGTSGIMLGRGAVADPALPRSIAGGKPLDCDELSAFHDELLDGYLCAAYSPHAAIARLKELWFYMAYKFPDSGPEMKRLLKSQRLDDYRAAAQLLFNSGRFNSDAYFHQP